MRSSLGAPHSTERCKITNFSQRTQIFTTFSIQLTPKTQKTTAITAKIIHSTTQFLFPNAQVYRSYLRPPL